MKYNIKVDVIYLIVIYHQRKFDHISLKYYTYQLSD